MAEAHNRAVRPDDRRLKGAPAHRRPPGRKKGVPNLTTKAAAEAVLKAFEELGGANWLKTQAKEKPELVTNLIRAILPRDMSISGQLNLGLDDVLSRMKS